MPVIRYDRQDALNTKSNGEKMILQALAASKEIDDWIILHSLDILHNQYRTQGEADLIILAPKLGVLVLEVKDAAQIERSSSGDWLISGAAPNRGSPFKQASESMWNIRNYLDSKGISTRGVNFFYGVWFTRVLASKFGSSIEWQSSQILGAEHLASGAAASLVEKFKEQSKTRTAHENSSTVMSKIANTLRPVVPKHADPFDRQKLLDRHLELAIEQQKELYTLFANVQAYAVSGLAGTGKTFLAVAEAKKAHLRGEPTLLVCFNSLLAKELKKRLEEYPHVRVATLHALMAETLGEEFAPEQSDEFWKKTLPDMAIAKLLMDSERQKYQTLIIDEAQDLGVESYLDFLELMLEKGLSGSKTILYGDFVNQAIYTDGQSALALYSARISHLMVPDALTVNCRNTVQVGEFVADFISMNPSYSKFLRSDEMTKVEMLSLPDGAEPKKHLVKAIDDQRKLFPPKSIVVLSSQKEKLENLVLSIPGKFRRLKEGDDSAVRFGTIQEFKGLEASSIILVEFEDGGGSVRDHFYIASTRATANFTFVLPASVLNKLTEGTE